MWFVLWVARPVRLLRYLRLRRGRWWRWSWVRFVRSWRVVVTVARLLFSVVVCSVVALSWCDVLACGLFRVFVPCWCGAVRCFRLLRSFVVTVDLASSWCARRVVHGVCGVVGCRRSWCHCVVVGCVSCVGCYTTVVLIYVSNVSSLTATASRVHILVWTPIAIANSIAVVNEVLVRV